MPIDMNVFIQQANATADDTRFYVKDENITQQSNLTGLKKLSIFARRAENNSAAKSFLTALSNDNRYADYLAQVRAPLDALISAHKPLTAGVVCETMQNLQLAENLAKAINAGMNFARENKIPQGHGTSFGQFAVARGLPLETAEDCQKAIKEYLLEQVIPKNEIHLTKLPDTGSERRNCATEKILRSVAAPLMGQNGFFAKQIDALFEAGYAAFSFENLIHSFHTGNLPVLEQLNAFSEDLVANIANSQHPEYTLKLFSEAAGAVPENDLSSLLIHSFETGISLDSPESRANCITHYMVERQGTSAAENVMTAHDLPKEFASAIGHNPEVAAKARELLAENPGAGHVPTQARVADALAQAAEELTKKYETQLQEFKGMAENPICDLKPTLSVATMPRYINCLLTGERLFEPLLADGIALDETFIGDLAKHAEAMNSATHSVKGDFGADDINQVAQNSVRILLAKHNVNPQQYLEVMNRIENKFGKLASDLVVLNNACTRNLLGGNGFAFLSKGMTMYRALESYAKALVSMLNHDQKVELHLADTQGLAPGNFLETQEREGRLLEEYLEKNFQRESDLKSISSALRDFAEHSGLRMPALAEEDRARFERAEENVLSRENELLANAVHAEYIPSTGRLIENRTDAFISLFAAIALKYDLTGIDAGKLDLTAFTESVRSALNRTVSGATEENRPVAADDLHRAVHDAVTDELVKLKGVLDGIDAAEGFTAEEKAIIKDTVQETGLRDTAAVLALANKARENDFSLSLVNAAFPAADADQIAETSLGMMEKYLDVRGKLPENFAGSEDAMAFMLGFAMKNVKLTNAQALALFENLNGSLAQNVASTFNWAADLCEGSPQKMALMIGTPQMMSLLRMLAEVKAKGNADIESMFFSGSIDGAHQISGGFNGMMNALRKRLGLKIISDSHIALSDHVPPYGREEWGVLDALIQRLEPTVKNPGEQIILPNLISNAGTKILHAVDKNGEIQTKDLWRALVGSKCPSHVNDENFFETAYAVLYGNYAKQYKKACPNVKEYFVRQMFMSTLKLGFSAEKLIELAKPGASISLGDISYCMDMSSLRGYTEENAFGLVTDFSRKNSQTTLSFQNAQGNSYSLKPFHISEDKNNANHPEFIRIMDMVKSMTHSDAQFRRVMQAYSQASLIAPRTFSQVFPGVQYSEHGNFQISAREQADGSVLVDIRTDDKQPLLMHEQFKIKTDGSHTCTVFNMSRPKVRKRK